MIRKSLNNSLGKFIRRSLSALSLGALFFGAGCDYTQFEGVGIDFYSANSGNPYPQTNYYNYRVGAMSDNGLWIAGCYSSSYYGSPDQKYPYRAKLRRNSDGSLVTVSSIVGSAGRVQLEQLDSLSPPSIQPPSTTESVCPVGINDSGVTIATWHAQSGGNFSRAFVWETPSNVRELNIPSQEESFPYPHQVFYYPELTDINNAGQVVGYGRSADTFSTAFVGALWASDGSFVGRHSGSYGGMLAANSGEFLPNDPFSYSMLYVESLLSPPWGRQINFGSYSGRGNSINDAGTVVGMMGVSSAPGIPAPWESLIPFVSRKSATDPISSAEALQIPSGVQYTLDLKIGNDGAQTIGANVQRTDGIGDIVIYRDMKPYLVSRYTVGDTIIYPPPPGMPYYNQNYVIEVNKYGEVVRDDGLLIRKAHMGDFNHNGCLDVEDKRYLDDCRKGVLNSPPGTWPNQGIYCDIFDFDNDGSIGSKDVNTFNDQMAAQSTVCPVPTPPPYR